MTTLTGIRVTPFDLSRQYAPNLLPYTLSFNDGTATPSVSSGTGTAQLSTIQPFDGANCMKITNGVPASNIVCNVTGSLQIWTSLADGTYPFQFSIRNPAFNGVPATGKITVFVNTIAQYEITFDTEEIYDNWVTFYANIPFFEEDVATFTYTYNGNASVSAFTIIYVDGLDLALNDRLMVVARTYSPPNNILRQLESLNFPSTAAGAESQITVIFPGSVVGEYVSIGVPAANVTAGGRYDAYVDTPGTVKARFWNNTGSTIDPPIGNFPITIIK